MSHFKEERILINSDEEHNKFWAARQDPKTHTTYVRWGRLGTKGQSQTKSFSSEYAAESFLSTKYHEKKRKGYTEVKTNEFNQRATEAAILGSANKCGFMEWAKLISSNDEVLVVQPISIEELYKPDCIPVMMAGITTRKGGEYELALALDKTYKVTGASYAYQKSRSRKVGLNWTDFPLSVVELKQSDDEYDMSIKIQEAIGNRFSA